MKNLLKQDFDDVYYNGQLETLNSYESFKGNLSGVVVSTNDVNAVEHNVGVKLRSKNLCSNIFTDWFTNTSPYRYQHIADTTWITSLRDKDTSVDTSGCYFGVTNTPGNGQEISWIISNGAVRVNNGLNISHQTSAAGVSCPYLIMYPANEETFNKIMQRWDIQVELGTTATEYTPYVSDFTSVEVTRYGKNLFDSSQLLAAKDWTETDGVYSGLPSYLYDIYRHDTGKSLFNDFTPNTQYKISFTGYSDDENTMGSKLLTFRFKYSDGTTEDVWIKNNVETTYTLISTAGKTVVGLHMSYGQNPMCYVWDIQLEIGTTATPYEPYISPTTYQSTADGTVEGITSISPNIILLSNAPGVIINANYYRDLDIYISNLQQAVALSGGE